MSTPSFISQTSHTIPLSHHSNLSFCLPTSLAFFKRLTWEQTPWLHAPLSAVEALTISQHLRSPLATSVPPAAIQNALLFGSTYPLNAGQETLGAFPLIFIIFPHAEGAPCWDETFLAAFHDGIVKPAFDTAWRNSRLALVRGADGFETRTPQDALPAHIFTDRFRNADPEPVRAYWPVFYDTWNAVTDRCNSTRRAHLYDEAWVWIESMLNIDPALSPFRDPILLAVSRSRVPVAPDVPAEAQFRAVVQEWEQFMDGRFVEPGSFKAVFETVRGTQVLGTQVLGIQDLGIQELGT